MSRSGYTDDCDDNWAIICYRGALKSAMRGKKGQAFLKELLAALDAMPRKRLIREHLEIDGSQDWWTGGAYDYVRLPQLIVGADELCADDGTVAAMGEVCALGALGKARGHALYAAGSLPEDHPQRSIVRWQVQRLYNDLVKDGDTDRAEKIKHLMDWFDAGAVPSGDIALLSETDT